MSTALIADERVSRASDHRAQAMIPVTKRPPAAGKAARPEYRDSEFNQSGWIPIGCPVPG